MFFYIFSFPNCVATSGGKPFSFFKAYIRGKIVLHVLFKVELKVYSCAISIHFYFHTLYNFVSSTKAGK